MDSENTAEVKISELLGEALDELEPPEIYNRFMKHLVAEGADEDALAQFCLDMAQLSNQLIAERCLTGAYKITRVLAEYWQYSESQNLLGVMFSCGAGVEQDDAVAMYWFNKAADQGHEAAKVDCEGIYNAYKQNLSHDDFDDVLHAVVTMCENGSIYIPLDPAKAEYWLDRQTAENREAE